MHSKNIKLIDHRFHLSWWRCIFDFSKISKKICGCRTCRLATINLFADGYSFCSEWWVNSMGVRIGFPTFYPSNFSAVLHHQMCRSDTAGVLDQLNLSDAGHNFTRKKVQYGITALLYVDSLPTPLFRVQQSSWKPIDKCVFDMSPAAYSGGPSKTVMPRHHCL